MAFGGFGGFGSNNNQQQSSGFGGFGSNNNTSGGFGSSNTGFGSASNTTGGGLFGSSNTGGGFGSASNTTGGGLFGSGNSGGGGFGSASNTTGGGLFGSSNTGGGFGTTNNNQNSSPFGKPAFGSNTTSSGGGGIFGSNTATTGSSGFGGFGSNTNNANTSSPFGGGNTGSSSVFGQNKPAFGSGTSTSGSLFGGGSGGFGSTNNNTAGSTSGGFGTSSGSAFGTAVQAPNNGTGTTPFSAPSEKDGVNGANSYYQSITSMQPYQGYSFEELRLVDYAQGRRFGNTNGQGGAFGQSTGFGGFGSNNTGAFGGGSSTTGGGGLFGQQQNNTSSSFGTNNQQTNTGFGSTSTGGIFGQNKPAGGGLFGTNTSTSGQQSGGLFGTSGGTGFGSGTGAGTGTATATGTGFGSNTGTGGGLFGNNQNQNQNQNKPFGGFGSTGTGFGSGSTAFGGTNASNNTGSNLFGTNNNASSTPFGGNQQQQNTASNPFGGFGSNSNQNQNQNQGQNQQQQGGGLFGGFGNQNNQNDQQKTGGLFGNNNASTSGGLFGNQNQNQTQQSGGLFGNNNNQQQNSGGLFGQPKPANTSTSLFGNQNNTSNTSTGGGLFGNLGSNQNQQNQGSNLFGNNNQQQSKPMFGASNTTNNNTGGGLFGNLGQTNTNNNTSSFGGTLFGNNQQPQQQQQPQTQQSGGLFGNSLSQSSFNQQPQQPQPTSLTASLISNPYGNDQLFATLATPQQSVGPLATPLSSAQKQRSRALLPQYKLNPAASNRTITPQRRAPMYGFSYSTYGTPGSAMSSYGTPPGLGNSLLGGGGLGRSLSKSYSTSSLRNSFRAEDSILAPGLFSGTRPASNSGSMKRLTINRNLRMDLFSAGPSDSTPRKSVSFDSTANGEALPNGDKPAITNGESTKALVRIEDSASPTPPVEEPTSLRSSRSASATPRANGVSSAPEMEQVKGNELAVVPEDESPQAALKTAPLPTQLRDRADKKPSKYWSQPTIQDLKNYSQKQLQHIPHFIVGRSGCGKVDFNGPDLTETNLDDILGGIVVFDVRSLTVYPNTTTKPPQGQGLNVFSTVVMENSWPRAQGGKLPVHENKGPRFDNHIKRLARVDGTKYVDYNANTGEWTFTVDHYTTYGLDYDEDEGDTTLSSTLPDPPMMSGALADGPGSPTPDRRTPAHTVEDTPLSQADSSMLSLGTSSPDDTFDFKRGKRKTPGGFEDEFMYADEDVIEEHDEEMNSQESFLDERSVGSSASDINDGIDEFEQVGKQQMVGSFPRAVRATEQPLVAANQGNHISPFKPKSILKTSQMPSGLGTPGRFEIGADWTEQLQRTVSPKKRDRQALRESQGIALKDLQEQSDLEKGSVVGRAFENSMDVMNSLFGKSNNAVKGAGTKVTAMAKGFEWPYAKRTKLDEDFQQLDDRDKAYYRSFKPSWSGDNVLSYASQGIAQQTEDEILTQNGTPLVSEKRDIRFAKLATPPNLLDATLNEQKRIIEITVHDGLPLANTPSGFTFKQFADALRYEPADNMESKQRAHEQHVWDLASILFDDTRETTPEDLSEDDVTDFRSRSRKENLQSFWEKLVKHEASAQAASIKARTHVNEEKAFYYLSAHNLVDAIQQLVEGNDFRLATMVSQLGSMDETSRNEIATQLDHWRAQNVLSEIPEPLRAIYELLAGHTCECKGSEKAMAEDRASTFTFSGRFHLDWRRSFGLRLWYGLRQGDALENAISMYAADRASGREKVSPVPWFMEQLSRLDWPDYKNDKREDVLWSLLKLYASLQPNPHSSLITPSLESIVSPDNISTNPSNARLAFQLGHLLHARNIAHFTDPTSLDKLTLAYATTLSNANDWLPATLVLLHLSSPSARESSIRALLTRHASQLDPSISSPALNTTSNNNFSHLTNVLKIPVRWLHDARAIYARTVLHNPSLEIAALVKAGDVDEAHRVLCHSVAPAAVISNDLDGLRESLGEFERAHGSVVGSGGVGERRVKGWESGGGVFFDYVYAVDLVGASTEEARRERRDVLSRLVERLPRLVESRRGGMGGMEVQERVAVWEMGRWVGEAIRKEDERKGLEAYRMMKLPLTEDAKLKQTVEMSMDYYRTVMAGGR
ncbi:MAG: hypothetical protein M1820_009284 [Bogoriella megaspora]|nr:MAG: hypothetical protein M1820_009284 [Bogoriella megaspora]